MKKALRDALQAYAAAVPHLGADTLLDEIKARARKGATEGEIANIARTIVVEHERGAVAVMGNARVNLDALLARIT